MIYFLIIAILILALFIFLLYSPLKITVEYRNQKLSIEFRCRFLKWRTKDSRLKKKKTDEPASKDKGNMPGVLERLTTFRKSYDGVKDIVDEVLDLVKNRAQFSGIFVRVRYGTGEAAITGMIYGAIWALVGNVYSFLCRFFRIEFPVVELEPVFGGKAFEIEAEGIITTKLVHIITAGFRSLRLYSKNKKEKGAK